MDEDYVQHMFQKYRLAVALAVLRNKPPSISVENYISELKSKIRDSELNDTLSNISVDEDDFNISDDALQNDSINLSENSNGSITILQNYDFDCFGRNADLNSISDVTQILDNYVNNQDTQATIAKETPTPSLTQSTHFENSDIQQHQDSTEIKNYIHLNKNTNSYLEYKSLNDDIKIKVHNNLGNDTQPNEHETGDHDDQTQSMEAIITNLNIYDSQETEIYNLPGCSDYNTHVSQSQDNYVIGKNYLINKEKINANKKCDDVSVIRNNPLEGNTETNTVINDPHAKSKVHNFINKEFGAEITQNTYQESESIQLHVRKKLKPIQYTIETEQNGEIMDIDNVMDVLEDVGQNNKTDNNDECYNDAIFSQDSQLFGLTGQEFSNKINLNKHLSQEVFDDRIYQNEMNTISLDFEFNNNSNILKTNQNANQSNKHFISDVGLFSSQSEIANQNSDLNNTKLDSSQIYQNGDALFAMNATSDSLYQDSQGMDTIENEQNIADAFVQYSNEIITAKSHENNKISNITQKEDTVKTKDIEVNCDIIDSECNLEDLRKDTPRSSETCQEFGKVYQNCFERYTKKATGNNEDKKKSLNEGTHLMNESKVSTNERNGLTNERIHPMNESKVSINERNNFINERIHPTNESKVSINERNNFINERIHPMNESKVSTNERKKFINERIHPMNESKISTNERNDFINKRIHPMNESKISTNERINCLIESDSDAETIEDLSDSQAEIVPFKVIEELNKIKMYLNKRNRADNDSRGADSGYRSSSRESYNASQSTQWLNQSSHCLFSYLSQCPLLVSTMEINYEIAKVLGLLIDRLHDDEKYPTFLEEMLEFVDGLLQNVYEGNFEDDNVFLKSNENIDRLLLLNRSQHIIKFTIEKITNILERFYERLQNGSHVELENINTLENLCFIFHLLEILLKNHSTMLTQNSQLSQDERTLKRCTLTEIWRKKWNLSKTEVFHKEETRDVTGRCSDVLNKIIVRAMDGYSLVAFAALQCFNLLQS